MEDGRIAAFGYSWDRSYTTYLTAVVWLPNGEADASFCSQGYLAEKIPEVEGWEGFEIKGYNEFIVHTFNNRDSVLEYTRRVYGRK